jgi:Potential Queuosine, Q, salvage protein family
MRLLDEVRAQAAAVAGSARFVSIADERIAQYAASLPLDQARAPQLDPRTHYVGEPERTLAYVVTLDAINFGSGYFPYLHKRLGLSGYFTLAGSLKDLWESRGPLSARDLRALSTEDSARIFDQSLDEPVVAELMALFARALNDLGEYLIVQFGGSFRALVDAADGSAERLVSLLAAMPFFADRGFYKRAQLTAADLAVAGVAEFHDLDRLTIFADNLVPHVLRVDGVLRYDADLLARIGREELIPAGSAEEREIRGCTLHAVELIRGRLDAITSMQLDYVLWNRGQQPAYKAVPRHRTRTVFY